MYKIALIVFIVCFAPAQGKAQQIVYSSSLGNSATARCHIIGMVKDHIIVWNFNFGKFGHSYIMIYDTNLKLSRKVSTNILKSDTLYGIDFIQSRDHFCVFYQYRKNKSYFARLAWFDENGHCTRIKTVDSTSLNANSAEIIKYPVGVIQSRESGSFALVKVIPNLEKSSINVKYSLYNDSLIHSGEVKLPFDYNTGNINSFILDEKKDLWLTETENNNSGSLVRVYKINTLTDSVTNTVRNIGNGHLVERSVNIFVANEKYLVYGEWTSPFDSSSSATSIKGIFVWQLHPDLTDVSTDTVLEISAATDSCLTGKNFFTLQALPSADNEFSFATGPGRLFKSFFYNGPYDPSDIYSYRNFSLSEPQPSSSPRYSSFVPVGNGLYKDIYYRSPDPFRTYSEHRPHRLPSDSVGPILIGDIITGVVHINSQNKIMWRSCFLQAMNTPTASANASVAVVGQKALHIIYTKTPVNNTESLEKVSVAPDGSFSLSPIISMNLNYRFVIGMARPISRTAIIVPCIKNDRLAFAKIEIE
jgi:hypothetical protein